MPAVEDYKVQRRDSVQERALAGELRACPESQRFEFIMELLPHNPILALEMARTTLNDPRHFEAILEQGIREADASSIRVWVDCVAGRMGFARTIRWLQARAVAYPKGVGFARYHLLHLGHLPGFSRAEVTGLPGI